MRKNKVCRVSLSGGIIGALTTNPRKALEDMIDKQNQEGWTATQVSTHRTSNLFILLAQVIVLVVTLGLWTWGGGYMVLFEREA